MEWIKCTDRLPDEVGEDYTYMISDGESIGIGWYEPEYESDDDSSEMIYSSDVWHEEGGYLSKDMYGWPEVIYWMPLPKLPEV